MAGILDICSTIIIDVYQSVSQPLVPSYLLVLLTFHQLTAEAFITITFIRNIPSIGVPFGVVGWIASIGVAKLFIISGSVSIIVCLLLIPFIIYGRRMRQSTWQSFDKVVELKGETRH